MKKFFAILAAVAVSASAAYAGCGKKVDNEGKLTSYDADTKAIVVTVGMSLTVSTTMSAQAPAVAIARAGGAAGV